MKSKINFVFFFIILFFYSVNLVSQQGWYTLNTSIGGFSMYFKDANNGIVGVDKTTDGGLTWNYTGSAGGDISFPNQNTGYSMGFSLPIILKTTNFGVSWILQQNPVFTQFYPWKIFFPNVNTGYACGMESYIIKTTNGGNNWFLLNTPLSNNFYLQSIFFTDAMTGFTVGFNYEMDTSVIMRTINGGTNWVYQLYRASYYGRFTSLCFIDVNTGIVGSTGDILKTTNAGLNWRINFMVPTQNSINSLYFPSATTGYGACYGGQIIKTTDGGDNWYLQNTGTGSTLYDIFFVNNLTGYACGLSIILKTTDGGGPPIGIKPISNNIPEKHQLFQNYPNPFNPVTTISFALPKSAFVKLVIYDILGRKIKELVNGYKQQGIYNVEFDAENFASGIYFYKLETLDYVKTNKMLLLR